MRTLNVRLALICLIALVVAVGTVHGVHVVQIKRHADYFKEISKREKEESDKETDVTEKVKKYKSAVEHLYWYVALRQDDSEARRDLAFWLVEGLRYDRAYPILEELLRTKGSNSLNEEQLREVRRKLVDVFIALHRYSDAVAHLDELVRDKANDAELLDMKGRCLTGLGKPSDAVEAYTAALKINPGMISAYTNLAFTLRKDGKLDAADQVMQHMVEVPVNQKSPAAHANYCYYLLSLNRFDKMFEEAKKLLELAPKDSAGLWLAGLAAMNSQNFDEAAKYAERGITVAKDNHKMYTLLADVRLRTNNRPEALAVLKQGLEATKGTLGYAEILWHLANLNIEMKNYEDARKNVGELRELNYSPTFVGSLDARILFSQQKWKEAQAAFEKIRFGLGDNPSLLKHVNYWLGQCYGQSGDIDRQFTCYRDAVQIDKFFIPARAGIAEILLNGGNIEQALAEYREIEKIGVSDEMVLLAEARTLIMYNLRLPIAKRNWEEVRLLLNHIFEINPKNGAVPLLQAEVFLAQGAYDKSEEVLLKNRDANPSRSEFWTGLAALAEKQEKWELADMYLREARAKVGDSVAWRLARAQYFVQLRSSQGKAFDAGAELYKLSEDTKDFSREDRSRLWNGLAVQCVQTGDFKTAKHLCSLVAQAEPANLKVRYLLFELAIRAQAIHDMSAIVPELDEMLKEMERIGGRGPLWLYGQAVRLSILAPKDDPKSPMLVEAQECIARARETRNTWSRLPLLAGGIAEQQGNSDLALRFYGEAIHMGEQDTEIIRRTIALFYQRQRYEEAKKLLDYVDKKHSSLDPRLARLMVQIYMKLGEDFDPLWVGRGYDPHSKDWRDHLWGGQVLQILARKAAAINQVRPSAADLEAAAEKALNTAIQLEPKAGDNWIVLVQLYAALNQPDKARIKIAQAEQAVAPEQKAFTLAHCYEAMRGEDDLKKAAKYYDAALAAKFDDPFMVRHVAEFYLKTQAPLAGTNGATLAAEPLLKRLMDSKNPAVGPDANWARRAQAGILLNRGGYPNLQAALKLIEQNLASPNASADDQRVKVVLLQKDPARARGPEAMALIRAVRENGEGTPEDTFNLAELCRMRGEWVEYRTLMVSLLSSKGALPPHLISYIRTMLQHDELTAANEWLRQLEDKYPHEYSTVALRAEYLFRSNRQDDAIAKMDRYIDDPKALPVNGAQRSLLAANLIEEFAGRLTAPSQSAAARKFQESAETHYRGFVSQARGRDVIYAAYLARQNRVTEAMDIIEKHLADTPADALMQVNHVIVRSPAATAAQIKQMENLLLAKLSKEQRDSKNGAMLLIALAELCTMQERFAEAEKFYKEVLMHEPDNASVFNNLAVLMAFSGKNLDEALEMVNKALTFAGPLPAIVDSRAIVRLARNEAEDALHDLELLSADQPSAITLFHTCRAHWMLKDKQKAAQAWQAALKAGLKRSDLDPPERRIYDELRDKVKDEQ